MLDAWHLGALVLVITAAPVPMHGRQVTPILHRFRWRGYSYSGFGGGHPHFHPYAAHAGCAASSGWRILPVGSHVCLIPSYASPALVVVPEDKSGTALAWMLPFHRDFLYAVARRQAAATGAEAR